MASGRPPGRFLLRASALVIGLLILWWSVLVDPLVSLLRVTVEGFATIIPGNWREVVTETAAGDWSVQVPLEIQSGGQQIHSIDFDIRRPDVLVFTFSLPVYWAIMLAVPGVRQSPRPLILGTIVTVALEAILFLVFAEISARNAATQLFGPQMSGIYRWFLRFSEYLVVNVFPFIAPFVIAIGLHRELRGQVFERSTTRGRGVSTT